MGSAEQGHASGQFNLAMIYRDGEAVEQDHAEAARWFARAAEQGNVHAQLFMGVISNAGEGVPRDYPRALMWLELAAEGGERRAVEVLEKVEGSLSAAQVGAAQRMATEWREQHPKK
jgi:TPR repeat protein